MFCPLDVVSNFPFFPKNALKNPSVIPLTINQEAKYYVSESSTQQLNICFTISIIISLSLFSLLCQRRIRFLIESLATLCVCWRPVHIPGVRKQENRLLVSSVCRFHICATLKRDNSIQHAERAMRHFEMSYQYACITNK